MGLIALGIVTVGIVFGIIVGNIVGKKTIDYNSELLRLIEVGDSKMIYSSI